MNRVLATLVVVLAVLALVTVAFMVLTGNGRKRAEAPGGPPPGPAPVPVPVQPGSVVPGDDPQALRQSEVTLFFSRPDGEGLSPEPRLIYQMSSPLGRMKQAVSSLVAGPGADSPLLAVLPRSTPLLGIYLDAEGTVWVDFGRELTQNLPRGTAAQRLAMGALAHTLIQNFPAVRQVRVLVMGEELRTLGGHLDLSRPLEADPALVIPLDTGGQEGDNATTPPPQQEESHAETGRPAAG